MNRQLLNCINNTTWQKGVRRADVVDMHVHGLRHTVGTRLGLTAIGERTQDVRFYGTAISP